MCEKADMAFHWEFNYIEWLRNLIKTIHCTFLRWCAILVVTGIYVGLSLGGDILQYPPEVTLIPIKFLLSKMCLFVLGH